MATKTKKVNWNVWPHYAIEDFVNRSLTLKDLRSEFRASGHPEALTGVYTLERLGVQRARAAARKALARRQ